MHAHRTGLLATRVHYFQAVVRTGSVRRAAVQLNVAPSAISRSIAQLEQDLGTALFERVRQRLKLTSAGDILVYHTRISDAELSKACGLIDDLKGLRRGVVHIAVAESAARGLLPDTLAQFWKHFPEISVEVHIAGSRQGFDAVLEGACDLALAFDDRESKKGLRQLAEASLGVGAVVRPDHRLARRARISMRDVADERVLMSDSSLTLAASIEEAMRNVFASADPRARTNSISIMTELSLRGCGIAFQTRVGVESELARGDLVFIPL